MNGVISEEEKHQLADILQIEELANMTLQTYLHDVLPPCTAGFAEGDIPLALTTGKDTDWALAVVRAAITAARQPPVPEVLSKVQVHAAQYYDLPQGLYGSHQDRLTAPSSVRIKPDRLHIAGESLTLAETPQVVVDLGACVAKRSLILDHIDLLTSDDNAFQYIPITQLLFPIAVFENIYRSHLYEQDLATIKDGRIFWPFVGHIAERMDHAKRIWEEAGYNSQSADIILCTNQTHIDNMPAVVERIPQFLRPNGLAVVGAPVEPYNEYEISALAMERIAVEDAHLRIVDKITDEADMHTRATLADARPVEYLLLAHVS